MEGESADDHGRWPLPPRRHPGLAATGMLLTSLVLVPLMAALQAAPGLLWHRIGTWIGLGLFTMLITFAATGIWQLFNRSPFVAVTVRWHRRSPSGSPANRTDG